MPVNEVYYTEVIDSILTKLKLEAYKEVESIILEHVAILTLPEQIEQKCELLKYLANAYLGSGNLKEALGVIEELDSLVIQHHFPQYLSIVFVIRTHFAILHQEYEEALSYVEQGLEIASRYNQYYYIARLYQVQQYLALINRRYEDSVNCGRLALHFGKKKADVTPRFILRSTLALVEALSALNKNSEAKVYYDKANRLLIAPKDATAQLLLTTLHTIYQLARESTPQNEEQLLIDLQSLWQGNQYNLVKLLSQHRMNRSTRLSPAYEDYLSRQIAMEGVEEKLKKLTYSDKLRAVSITNAQDEKIGFLAGEAYREKLQQHIDKAKEHQFITIATFIIRADHSDILSRHLKVKYDLYMKIDRDLASFYPKSIKGKFYSTSFSSMFITDEELDLPSIGAKCQGYLDEIELVLEDTPIHYFIHIGASVKRKCDLTSMYDLYQEADQSLYYANVTKQPIVIYGR